jgi:molybdopterin adenylyltransferase
VSSATTRDKIRIGVVTVSDRASSGEYQDLGGPAIRDWMDQALLNEWQAVARLVPDEQPIVEAALKELCDDEG